MTLIDTVALALATDCGEPEAATSIQYQRLARVAIDAVEAWHRAAARRQFERGVPPFSG